MTITRPDFDLPMRTMEIVLPEEWRVGAQAIPEYCPHQAFDGFRPQNFPNFTGTVFPNVDQCKTDYPGSIVGDVKAKLGLTVGQGDQKQQIAATLGGKMYISDGDFPGNSGGGPQNPVYMFIVIEPAQITNPITGERATLALPAIPMRMFTRKGDNRIDIQAGIPPLSNIPAWEQVGLRELEIKMHGGRTTGLVQTPPTQITCQQPQIFDFTSTSYPEGSSQTVSARVPVNDPNADPAHPGSLSGCDRVSLPFEPTLDVTTDTTQAGASPVLGVHITRNRADDYMGDLAIHLPEYMLGSPFAVSGACTTDTAERAECPQDSKIADAALSIKVFESWPFINMTPEVFNAPTDPGDIATFIMVIEAPPIADSDILTIPVHLAARPNASGIDATIHADDMPKEFSIQRIDFDFNGPTGAPEHPLLFNAYECDPSAISVDFGSEMGLLNSRTQPYQSTRCEDLAYKPELKVKPTCTATHCLTGIEATFTSPLGSATTKRVQFDIPSGFKLNGTTTTQDCPPVQATTGACPAESQIGTAVIRSPLTIDPLIGSLFLGTDDCDISALKCVYAHVSGLVDLDLVGKMTLKHGGGFTVTMDGLPPVPVTSMSFSLDGGPNALVYTPYQCGEHAFDYTLTSHTGREFVGADSVSISGDSCLPKLSVNLSPNRAGQHPRLTATVAHNVGTAPIKEIDLNLGSGSKRLKLDNRHLKGHGPLGSLSLTSTSGKSINMRLVKRGRRILGLQPGGKRAKNNGVSLNARVLMRKNVLVIQNLPNDRTMSEIRLTIDGRRGLLTNPGPGKITFRKWFNVAQRLCSSQLPHAIQPSRLHLPH